MNANKIFCIGLSRTGTTSIAEELESLGIKSIHYPSSLLFFQEAINKELKFQETVKKSAYNRWRFNKELKAQREFKPAEKVLNTYQAFADLPIPYLYKFLDKKFPGSKFIYTYRTEKGWLKSMKWMLEDGRIMWNWGHSDDEILKTIYGTINYDEQKLKDAYRKHDTEVRQYFLNRKNDILFIDIENDKGIMQKIGEFLNVPVISEDMRKSNKAQSVSRGKKFIYHFDRKLPLLFLLKRLIKI